MEYSVPIVVYICPLFLGLTTAFLAVTSDFNRQGIKGLGKILLYYVTLPAAVVVFFAGIGLSVMPVRLHSDNFALSFAGLAGLGVFLWGWLALAAGVSCLLVRLGLNKQVSYISVSLLILLTNTTVFYINPFISAWQGDLIARQWVIKAGVAVNPMLVLAGNFFGHDLLRAREMYGICDIGPYYYYSYPDWLAVWMYYLGAGLLAFVLAAIIRKGGANQAN
jgi:hypothetical protein